MVQLIENAGTAYALFCRERPLDSREIISMISRRATLRGRLIERRLHLWQGSDGIRSFLLTWHRRRERHCLLKTNASSAKEGI